MPVTSSRALGIQLGPALPERATDTLRPIEPGPQGSVNCHMLSTLQIQTSLRGNTRTDGSTHIEAMAAVKLLRSVR